MNQIDYEKEEVKRMFDVKRSQKKVISSIRYQVQLLVLIVILTIMILCSVMIIWS